MERGRRESKVRGERGGEGEREERGVRGDSRKRGRGGR